MHRALVPSEYIIQPSLRWPLTWVKPYEMPKCVVSWMLVDAFKLSHSKEFMSIEGIMADTKLEIWKAYTLTWISVTPKTSERLLAQ